MQQLPRLPVLLRQILDRRDELASLGLTHGNFAKICYPCCDLGHVAGGGLDRLFILVLGARCLTQLLEESLQLAGPAQREKNELGESAHACLRV